MSDDDETLWKVQDVAKYLQVSTSLVYKKAEAGTIPTLRIGAALRFDPATVRAWAKSNAREVGP
jgi:excisionase family DNA binding protein